MTEQNQANTIEKVYQPQPVEARWWQAWEDAKVFAPTDADNAFSVVIPPPNVTGSLHMGHALNNTLQDILVRYHRMCGDSALWVFGLDHAGIATQNVVERQLKAEGKSRHDLGREEFIQRVWKWKEESGGTIRNQLKRLGSSLDYENERFTMDAGLSRAVREVFVRLYDEGKIYRAQRLINWCPRCHTALSDLEVEHEDIRGHLWHIRYPLADNQNEGLVVATTRPETLLGDSAVAVHPDDARYQHLVGKKLRLPLVGREIPIVADAMVDQSFGSGAVKITPAHDFNDFEAGQRHNLEKINILTEDARMNEAAGPFAGQDRFECRKNVEKMLQEQGLLVQVEDYATRVGHCYRCKTVVEPYLSLQWFVRTAELAQPCIAAVRDGRTKIIPKTWENTYFQWMENIQDWCISRQIWWGHRIPAWYCGRCADEGRDGISVSREDLSVCPRCGHGELTRETDVLDTWFSSALWPFSTLGWPDKTEALKKFYPTSVLITGFDIIFFWVARMMMMGLHFTGEVPFREVYIHALVRDAQGQKMSKSKGNVIDPLEIMAQHGTDALRFTLAAFAAQGRDIKLSEERIVGYRNFCNKLWNAARFVMDAARPYADLDLLEEQKFQFDQTVAALNPQHPISQWLLTQLSQTTATLRQKLDEYKFNEAAMALYHFFWGTYCDWFLELIKAALKSETSEARREFATVAVFALDQVLRLAHPIMPFLTEELWQGLAPRGGDLLATARFPRALDAAQLQTWEKTDAQVRATNAVVDAIRRIRMESGVPLSANLPRVALYSEDSSLLSAIAAISLDALGLAKSAPLLFNDAPLKSEKGVARGIVAFADLVVLVDLKGLVDLEKERQRQQKELTKLQKGFDGTEKLLASDEFRKKAPEELVAEKQGQLKSYREKIHELQEALQCL